MLAFEPRPCLPLKSALKSRKSAEKRIYEMGSEDEFHIGRMQVQVYLLLRPMSFLS